MKRASEADTTPNKRIKMQSKINERNCDFDDLPPEIQQHLFSYLDTKAFAQTSMTSSKWYSRLYQWRDRIYVKHDIGSALTLLRKLNDSNLRFLDISSFDPEAALVTELSRFTALQYLRLYNNNMEKQLPATLTSLTQLVLLGDNRNELLISLSKLTKLSSLELTRGEIQECSRLTQLTHLTFKLEMGFQAKYLPLFTQLLSLSIRPRLEQLRYIFSLTQLRALNITGENVDEDFPAHSWLSLLTSLNHLESLKFERGTIIEDDNEYAFMSHLKLVTRLHAMEIKLQSWPPNLLHLQAYELQEWEHSLPQLSQLTYLCSTDANEQHFKNISRLPHLKRLRTCVPDSPDNLLELTTLTNLNYLFIDIFRQHKSMYPVVRTLLQHLTNLVAVKIGRFTGEAAFKNFCPPGLEYLSFALEEFGWI